MVTYNSRVVLLESDGYNSGKLACLDTSSGQVFWLAEDKPVAELGSPGAIAGDECLLITHEAADEQYQLVCRSLSNGRVRWHRHFGRNAEGVGAPAAWQGRAWYVSAGRSFALADGNVQTWQARRTSVAPSDCPSEFFLHDFNNLFISKVFFNTSGDATNPRTP